MEGEDDRGLGQVSQVAARGLAPLIPIYGHIYSLRYRLYILPIKVVQHNCVQNSSSSLNEFEFLKLCAVLLTGYDINDYYYYYYYNY